jgi:sigma-B regulation protein RsbU (phosphoserine phosphatase)
MLIYTIGCIIVTAVKRNRKARVMLVGMAPFAACALFDVTVHNILKQEHFLYLGGFGFSAFLISIMFILANDFVTYHNEVEELNVSLDRKVEERTEELLRSKEETEKAMAEIEKAHGNLKSLNRELAMAHDTMKRDMDLAANVQMSLFPKQPPETRGWDIAFTFRPMSGVSGDIYDFFLMGDRLYGAALFDVSGHGIASGLITMIVKSVLYRNFTRHGDLLLNQLLQKMNRELIREMGPVDNYITGILLRFTENRVEYVNAGHTDLLMKSGRTGEARIVAPQAESFRGHFLGIDSMDEAFSMLRFTVQAGDSLLLYTDCLVESANNAGDQYGTDRLIRIFGGAGPDKSAAELANIITGDLRRHTGSQSLRDDLTVIVLKRTE